MIRVAVGSPGRATASRGRVSGELPLAPTAACKSTRRVAGMWLPAGHHLYLAGALSEAKPPEKWLPPEMFPDRESSVLLRDDSSGNIRLGSLPVGIASLNRRLNLDSPPAGKGSCHLSFYSFHFIVFSFQRVVKVSNDSNDLKDSSDSPLQRLVNQCAVVGLSLLSDLRCSISVVTRV